MLLSGFVRQSSQGLTWRLSRDTLLVHLSHHGYHDAARVALEIGFCSGSDKSAVITYSQDETKSSVQSDGLDFSLYFSAGNIHNSKIVSTRNETLCRSCRMQYHAPMPVSECS